MRNNMLKKGLVYGIIVLFIGAVVLPVARTMNIEKAFERAATGSGPDLECGDEISVKTII